jgi:hypothetical protein
LRGKACESLADWEKSMGRSFFPSSLLSRIDSQALDRWPHAGPPSVEVASAWEWVPWAGMLLTETSAAMCCRAGAVFDKKPAQPAQVATRAESAICWGFVRPWPPSLKGRAMRPCAMSSVSRRSSVML